MSSIDDYFDNDSLDEEPFYEESYNPIKDLIEKWLNDNCDIEGTYSINEDNSIDVEGSISISTDESELPVYIRFNNVSGDLDCSYCSSLESLEGAPKEVGGNFDCSSCNSLKNLEHAPIKVGGDFNCSNCYSLESMRQKMA